MSQLKKLVSQTAVYGLSTILGRLLNYLLVPLHTRVFGTTDYGVVSELYAYATFFIVALTYGMETAFFRFSQDEEKKDKVFPTAFVSIGISSIIFMLCLGAFAQPLANAIRYPDHSEYIIIFSLILGLDAIASIPFALLRQQSRPMKFVIVKNINILINILCNVYFLMLCPYMQRELNILLPLYDATIGVGYIFISNLVASIITLPLLFKEILCIRKGFDLALWKKMIVYGLPLLVVGLGGMVNETLDRAIMKYLLPAGDKTMSQIGIYGANYKLSILMSLFIQAFRFAAEPFFFSHAKTSDKKIIYAQVMDYFVIVCLGIFLLITLYIDLFKYFIGEQFYDGLKIVPVLLLANICLGVYYNLSIWYKLSDQTSKGALISLIGAGITIGLNIWWIPVFGYVGSAWATFVCYFSMMLMCYFMGMKYYPIPYHGKRVLRFAGMAFILFFTGWYCRKYYFAGAHGMDFIVSSALFLFFILAVYLFVKKDRMLTSLVR
ncbi:MAG: oligosaccharide flippase family protein [Candidatus Brocadiaceae bacterium]|nr:oligosaccharide flippase family protein [Candidatus Brocadiaceae bacterium]